MDIGLWKCAFTEIATRYEKPIAYVKRHVYPARSKNTRQTNAERRQYERPRVDMRKTMAGLPRFIATPGVSKHRIYVWRTPEFFLQLGELCLCPRIFLLWNFAIAFSRNLVLGSRHPP